MGEEKRGKRGLFKRLKRSIYGIRRRRAEQISRKDHLYSRLESYLSNAEQTARARVLEPRLTPEDLDLLTPKERDCTPFIFAETERPLPKTRNDPSDKRAVTPRATRYTYLSRGVEAEIPIDPELPAPTLEIEGHSLRPTLRMGGEFSAFDPGQLFYSYEVDVSPEFSSPNLLRYPTLYSSNSSRNENLNLTDPMAALYNNFAVQTREWTDAPTLKLPYSILAFCLPADWSSLSAQHVATLAHALTYAEPTIGERIKALFEYVRHNYVWGNENYNRTFVDVFSTKIGQCGHVNSLLAAMAETIGVRARSVSGFSPAARVIFPGGGHTAVEIYNSVLKKWVYVDPYLDVILESHGAMDIDQTAAGNMLIYPAPAKYRAVFGDGVTLAELFKFRTYFDHCKRAERATMLQLGRSEDRYGTTWKLDSTKRPPLTEILPGKLKLYARARYVVAKNKRRTHLGVGAETWAADATVRASEWAHYSAVYDPAQLLKGVRLSPAPSIEV